MAFPYRNISGHCERAIHWFKINFCYKNSISFLTQLLKAFLYFRTIFIWLIWYSYNKKHFSMSTSSGRAVDFCQSNLLLAKDKNLAKFFILIFSHSNRHNFYLHKVSVPKYIILFFSKLFSFYFVFTVYK